MQKKFIVVPFVLVMTLFGVLFFRQRPAPSPAGSQQSPKELNLLCWVGYDERDFLEPFEKKFGVKVNTKTYIGGDQMFALFTQSHGTYDAVVVDPEYVKKLHAAGRLA